MIKRIDTGVEASTLLNDLLLMHKIFTCVLPCCWMCVHFRADCWEVGCIMWERIDWSFIPSQCRSFPPPQKYISFVLKEETSRLSSCAYRQLIKLLSHPVGVFKIICSSFTRLYSCQEKVCSDKLMCADAVCMHRSQHPYTACMYICRWRYAVSVSVHLCCLLSQGTRPETVSPASCQFMADCRERLAEGKRSFVFFKSLINSTGRLIEASHS